MKVIVGLLPRGTSLSRIMSWTVAYMDQCMQEHRLQEHPLEEHRLQEHRLQEHLGTSSAGRNIVCTSSAGTSSGAAATRFEGDETPDCEEEGGGLSPCNTEDDCFATSRSLDRDVVRWISPATRLRFRPKSRISRSLVATRLRFRPKSRGRRSLAKQR